MDPNTLTGERVRAAREAAKPRISRDRFAELAGLQHRAAVWRIEVNDKWKPGERELVAVALDSLGGDRLFEPDEPATDTREPRDGETVPPATRDVAAITEHGATFLWDDSDDALAWVEDGPRSASVADDTRPVTTGIDLDVLREDDAVVMTNGQRATAQRCPRKWWLAWYRNLAPNAWDPANVRETGNRVHRALAAYYVADPATRVDPRDALERVLVEDWTRVVRAAGYEPGTHAELDDPRIADLGRRFHDAANLERAMVEGYVEWLAETGADQDLRVGGSEAMLVAEVGDIAGRPLRVLGLLDTRVTRTSDAVRLFIDHKTVGSLTDPVATLPMDEQMLNYHLIEWLNTPEGEARCDGALYNMLRRVKRTDRARPPFYDRVEVRHSDAELESYKRRLVAWSTRVAEWTDRLDRGEHHLDVVPPNPTRDCKWDCDFFGICPLFDDPRARVEDAVTTHFHTADPLSHYGSRNGEGGTT